MNEEHQHGSQLEELHVGLQLNTTRLGFSMDDSTTERARRLQQTLDRECILPTLQNSVQILELLANEPSGLSIEQIHYKTNICKSIVYRIVRTLVVWGCLVDSENDTYSTIDVHFPKGK